MNGVILYLRERSGRRRHGQQPNVRAMAHLTRNVVEVNSMIVMRTLPFGETEYTGCYKNMTLPIVKFVCSVCIEYASDQLEQIKAGPTPESTQNVNHPLRPSVSIIVCQDVTHGGGQDVTHGGPGLEMVEDSNETHGACRSSHPIPSTSTQDEHAFDEPVDVEMVEDETRGRPGADSDVFRRVIGLINTGQYESVELEELCSAIGKSLQLMIFKDSQTLHKQYNDLEELSNLDCVDFLRERPKAITAFLREMTNTVRGSQTSTEKLLPLCIAIEQIYKTRNKVFIGPFSLRNGIVKLSLTGSKTAHALDGASTASGSITTVKSFLKSSAFEPNLCFDNDVDIFSDNTQRTGKTVRVRESGTTPVGVATNVVFLQSNPPSDIQSRQDLKPGNWPEKSREDTMSDITVLEDKLNEHYFRPMRQAFQTSVLDEVMEELHFEEGGPLDHVEMVEEIDSSTHRVCSKCTTTYKKSQTCCPKCSNKPNNIKDRSELYGDIPNGHPSLKPNIKMGEIIGVNPNSRENLKHVVKDLRKQAGVGYERQWVRIGFDGVPYRIVESIIKDVVVCEECGEEVDTKKTLFAQHVDKMHSGSGSVSSKLLFDDVLLVPGAGHIETHLSAYLSRVPSRLPGF
jgi:hypothetical protein